MLRIGTTFIVFAVMAVCAQAAPSIRSLQADIAVNAAILTASSRLAADHTANKALIAYAATEPLASTSEFADGSDALRTGRSAAITGVAPDDSAPAASQETAFATAGLAALNSLYGASFDRLYTILQHDALVQIESDYRAYIDRGDSATLAKAAKQRLPDLTIRLRALADI